MKRFCFAALCPVFIVSLTTLLAGSVRAQVPAASGQSLLPGVGSIYAHQGDNTIIAYATPDGYARVRALVRHLDGDLDMIRTDVSLVTVSPAALKGLGITPAASDTALLAAFHSGRLPASDHIRLTTREDTPIDALLHDIGNGRIPLSLVPREDADGALSVELLQPAVTSQAVGSGGTVVARLPDAPNGTVRLLFLTPTLLPGGTRLGR